MSVTVSILDGSTFVVSDRKGDIDAGPESIGAGSLDTGLAVIGRREDA